MRIRERYELAAELKDRYRQATKRERGELLDAFCLASGYERKHAIKVLGGRRRKVGGQHRATSAAALGTGVPKGVEGGVGSGWLHLLGAAAAVPT